MLAELWPQHSRNRLQGWVREGRVLVDERPENEPKRKLLGGEVLVLNDAFCVRVSEIIEPLQPAVESSGTHAKLHSVPKSGAA